MDMPFAIAWFEDLVFPLVTLAVVAVWVYTLVDLWKNPSLSGSAKAMWMLIIVLLPIVGPVVYLIVRDDW